MSSWATVAKLAEIAPGKLHARKAGSRRVLLANLGGTIYAIEDTCTHDEGPLGEGELVGHVVECPRHGATFDVRTGAALTMPAVTGVKSFPVKIEGEQVLVEAS